MHVSLRFRPTKLSLAAALGVGVIFMGGAAAMIYRSHAGDLLSGQLPQWAENLVEPDRAAHPAEGTSYSPPHPASSAAATAEAVALPVPPAPTGTGSHAAPPTELAQGTPTSGETPVADRGVPAAAGDGMADAAGGPGGTASPSNANQANANQSGSGPAGTDPGGTAGAPPSGPIAELMPSDGATPRSNSASGLPGPSGAQPVNAPGSTPASQQPPTVFNAPTLLDNNNTGPGGLGGGGSNGGGTSGGSNGGGSGGGSAPTVANNIPVTSPGSPVLGTTPSNPITPINSGPNYTLPINPQNSQWQFFDPVVAVGYNYQLTPKNPSDALTFGITSIMVTTKVGNGVYQLWLYDLLTSQWVNTGQSIAADVSADPKDAFNVIAFLQSLEQTLAAENETLAEVYGITDLNMGLTEFSLRGIDPNAGLNPYDPNAFVTGLLFAGQINGDLQITPLAIDTSGDGASGQPGTTDVPPYVVAVPEPPSLWMAAAGLAIMIFWRRRRAVGRS